MKTFSGELLFLIVFVFLVAILLRLDFVFYVIYVLGAIWLLARWAGPASMRRLSVGRRFSQHIFLGESADVTLEIANRAWLPVPWLRINENLPLALAPGAQLRRVVTLRPRERLTIQYTLHGSRRGYYPVGPLQLLGGDLFGFAQIVGRDEGRQHITVYPRIIPLARLDLPSRLPFGTLASTNPVFEDPARLRGVRDYQAGDSLRRINWKASAHGDALLVKQFSPAISLESTLLLNLNRGDYSPKTSYTTSEWAVVVAASMASHLVGLRQAVGLGVNGLDPLVPEEQPSRQPLPIPARPGRPHLMKVLEVLARVELHDGQEPFAAWVRRAAARLSWGATVIVVTPNGEEPACRGLHALARLGLNVVLLVVEPYGQFGAVRERARRLGFVAFPVAGERELGRLQLGPAGREFRAA